MKEPCMPIYVRYEQSQAQAHYGLAHLALAGTDQQPVELSILVIIIQSTSRGLLLHGDMPRRERDDLLCLRGTS